MTVIRRKLRNNTNKIAREEKKEEVTRGRNETGKSNGRRTKRR
jgi:hypothetical protein